MTFNGVHPLASHRRIRSLDVADAHQALELSQIAGWKQDINDWQRLIRWSEGGTYGIEEGTTLVAIGVALSWGKERGRLANIITHPDYRLQGLARVVIQTLMRTLQVRGVKTIDLDATEEAGKLYEHYGFISSCKLDLYVGPACSTATPLSPNGSQADMTEIIAFDRQVFGAARSNVVKDLIQAKGSHFWVDRKQGQLRGYMVATKHPLYVKIGPWMHLEPAGAQAMVEGVVRFFEGQTVRIDTLDTNPHSSHLVNQLGLANHHYRHCHRMHLASGGLPQERHLHYYGIVAPTVG